MNTKQHARYRPIARFHRLPGRNEPVFLADGPNDCDWMIIKNKFRHDRRAAHLILLERPRSEMGIVGQAGPLNLARRSRIERCVAAVLKNLEISFLWQPDERLANLPGHPDFWLPKPLPTIISVRGCRPHAHDCSDPDASKVGEQEREFRRKQDGLNVARWEELGVPTIVVWGCAVTPDLNPLAKRLAQAIESGRSTELASE
jgi:G:T-mismatch repair DNA endonuclease (very short patch repair protein)